MGLPKETLELIQQTAQKAQEPQIVPGFNPRQQFLAVGGEIKAYDVPPPLRNHQVHSLEDLIAYTEDVLADVSDGAPSQASPVIWHGAASVQLIIDDTDRRDLVTFGLSYAKPFNTMDALSASNAAAASFDQRNFIRMLRFDLGLDNMTVVQQFRRLDWQQSDATASNLQHGNEKLGRDVEAKCQGIDELPDELEVRVPVYEQQGERDRYIVRCGVEIDVMNKRFLLKPLPGEVQEAIDNAQASIRQRLTTALGEKLPIYYGRP